MQIIISGRHFDVTEPIKQHISDRLESILDVKNLKITTARVILEIEKNRCKAEVIVNLKNHDIEAAAETYDMYEAMDTVCDKIEVQIKRLIDKVQDHHRGTSLKEVPLTETAEEEEEEELTF
jgi:putative sigma-54 modulation protein